MSKEPGVVHLYERWREPVWVNAQKKVFVVSQWESKGHSLQVGGAQSDARHDESRAVRFEFGTPNDLEVVGVGPCDCLKFPEGRVLPVSYVLAPPLAHWLPVSRGAAAYPARPERPDEAFASSPPSLPAAPPTVPNLLLDEEVSGAWNLSPKRFCHLVTLASWSVS